MSIRMMPIRSVFQRFPRLVRDICRSQNKEAELILEGEDTELDKTVIEQIGDPLVHLVRNALDYGIEPPEVREQAGKSRSGTVRLRAYNQGNNVVIEIRDDGRGMDSKKIKQKAVEKGLITAASANRAVLLSHASQDVECNGFSEGIRASVCWLAMIRPHKGPAIALVAQHHRMWAIARLQWGAIHEQILFIVRSQLALSPDWAGQGLVFIARSRQWPEVMLGQPRQPLGRNADVGELAQPPLILRTQ